MLVFESHLMPRETPETAETTKAAVSTAMTPMSSALETSPRPATICRPEPICSAPMPSEVAEPKSVAKIAKMSIARPMGPSTTRRPTREVKAAEMSSERRLRNTL